LDLLSEAMDRIKKAVLSLSWLIYR
jgi:hypothetical protein